MRCQKLKGSDLRSRCVQTHRCRVRPTTIGSFLPPPQPIGRQVEDRLHPALGIDSTAGICRRPNQNKGCQHEPVSLPLSWKV